MKKNIGKLKRPSANSVIAIFVERKNENDTVLVYQHTV